MSTPISISSEVDRMRASSESAHQYAERCELRTFRDDERRALAVARLNGIVSTLADLNHQIAQLEREVLAIADVLTQ